MTDPLRLGILGCGRVVEFYHASAILAAPAWRVTDVADVDPARLDWAATVFAGARRHDDCASLLEQGSAEALLIATPAGSHAANLGAALETGRAVLVEKPLATTVADAERLATRQAATGLTVAVGFNRRFRAGYRNLRNRLQAVGAAVPSEVTCTLITEGARWGRRAQDRLGSLDAMLDDVPPHQADLVPWLFGRPARRVQVTKKAEASAGPMLDYELDLAGGPSVRCRAGHGAAYVEELELDGALAVTGGDLAPLGRPAVLARSLGAVLAPARSAWARVRGRPSPARASFAGQLDAFAAALRSQPTDLADVEAGLRACRVVDACRRSLASRGAWIDIAEGGIDRG